MTLNAVFILARFEKVVFIIKRHTIDFEKIVLVNKTLKCLYEYFLNTNTVCFNRASICRVFQN